MMKNRNYIYILKCSDNTLYTGWTNDLENRIMNHNLKKGAKYTKNRLPAFLVYFEEFDDKREAMSREFAIKQLSRSEKEDLISHLKGVRKKNRITKINEDIKNI